MIQVIGEVLFVLAGFLVFLTATKDYWDAHRFPLHKLSALPPAGKECKNCGKKEVSHMIERNGSFVRDYNDDFMYEYMATLKAQKCPEVCQIQEQHLHVKCSYCQAEYATQV